MLKRPNDVVSFFVPPLYLPLCLVWLLYNFHLQTTIIWFAWIAPDGFPSSSLCLNVYTYIWLIPPPLINTIIPLVGFPLPPAKYSPAHSCASISLLLLRSFFCCPSPVASQCLAIPLPFLSCLSVSLCVIYAVQYFLPSVYKGHTSYRVRSLPSTEILLKYQKLNTIWRKFQ